MILGSILDLAVKALGKVSAIVNKGGKARVIDDDKELKEDEIYFQGVAIEIPDTIEKDSISIDENISDEVLAMMVTESIQEVDNYTQEWEVPDDSIRLDSGKSKPASIRKEASTKPVFPDGWSVAYYPAGGEGGGKPNLSYIREWVENTKLANMSNEDLGHEYSRVLGTKVPSKLDTEKRESLVDSITYMVARKIWYVGRRSADYTDAEWNEETKHMRPEKGSFGKNDIWKNVQFPYGQEYVYTSGDVHKAMSELKSGGKLSY